MGDRAVRVTRGDQRRTISPFDLTSTDNPGAIISYPLLNSTNYEDWSVSITTALHSRKKFGFCDGSISKPAEDSPEFEDWIPVNSLLESWIKMTIDDSLKPSISHRELAKDLWDYLKKRFSVSNGPRIQQIKGELAACKQSGQTIETYYGKLCKIWDTLAVLQPIRRCSCGLCTCNLLESLEKDREDDKVQQFLYGLDDYLQSIRSSLCNRVPLPSVEEAYNTLRQEEDLQSKVRKTDRSDMMAYAAVAKQFSADKSRLVCGHCKKTGHSMEKCFDLVGYPEWWADRGRGKSSKKDRTVVNNQKIRANAAGVIGDGTEFRPVTAADRDGVVGLSEDQWQQVVRLFNSGKPANKEILSGPQYEDSDWSG